MIPKTSLGWAAAGASLVFVGYCVYFDRKRRSDPNFRQKLREKRRQNKHGGGGGKGGSNVQLPNPRDTEAMQRFFLTEIQLGEELLSQGDVEQAVEHLCNAVAVCGQPQHLLQVLSQTLPQNVFAKMVQNLPAVTANEPIDPILPQRIHSSAAAAGLMTEEDVQ